MPGSVADRVAGFEYRSSAEGVPAGTLAEAVAALPAEVEVVVFRGPVDHGSTIDPTAAIGGLVERIGDRAQPGAQVAIPRVAAVDAVKRIEDGYVVEAVDRNTLNILRPPQVVDRRALAEALAPLDRDIPVAPAVVVAAAGGRIEIVAGPGSGAE